MASLALFRRVGNDRLKDRLVLFLDPAKIFAETIRVTFKRANALPRNDQAPEEIEKLNEAAIVGRQRDGLMEGEVLLDRTFATGNRAAEDALRVPDGFDLDAGCALAGNGGRLDSTAMRNSRISRTLFRDPRPPGSIT